jgi:hypothetical protein
MKKTNRYVKPISFRLRWLFMSPQERYSRLWARTKKLSDLTCEVGNIATHTSTILQRKIILCTIST